MTTAEYTGLQKLILGVRDELKSDVGALKSEMNERFDEVRTEFRTELRSEIGSLRSEMNERFDEVYDTQREIMDIMGGEHQKLAKRVDRHRAILRDHTRRITHLETTAA